MKEAPESALRGLLHTPRTGSADGERLSLVAALLAWLVFVRAGQLAAADVA